MDTYSLYSLHATMWVFEYNLTDVIYKREYSAYVFCFKLTN